MIPLSGKFEDNPRKKYGKAQNLFQRRHKKPDLAECRSCERFEEGPDSVGGSVGKIYWCVSKYFDKVKKRSVTCYANIELMDYCPKKVVKKQYRGKPQYIG